MDEPSSPARAAHLVLGAGGVRVISYIGVLEVLAEQGLAWRSISSCSAGTIVAALLAAGLTPTQIRQRVLDTDLRRLAGPHAPLRALSMVMRPFAQYAASGAPDVFREWVGGDPTFGELRIPFATAGVDVLSNRLLVYGSDTHADMRVSEALRIAVGIPGLYPPYEPQGRVVVDAAIATQVPVWMAAERPDGLPIVALRPRASLAAELPSGLPAYVSLVVEAGIASRDHYLLSQIPRLRMIEPDCGDLAAEDFDAAERTKAVLLERGRDAAREALPRLGEPARRAHVPAGPDIDDRAEARADRAMAGFHHALTRLTRDRVFVSYAHVDREWLERLQTLLQPSVHYERLELWDDTRIAAGANWLHEIRSALSDTRVAVLLVTPAFLASRFILDEELHYFLQASRSQGLTILWVPISACLWDATPLQSFQAAHSPSEPLDTLSVQDQNRGLLKVCQQIRAAMAV